MAGETLKTASQLLADYGDNTSGLIEAVNVRNHVVSAVPAIGFAEDQSATFEIDVTAAWTSINAEILPGPTVAANFWKLDGNQSWLPSYTDTGIIVPAGVNRLVGLNTSLNLVKVGGGTALYDFAVFSGGVLAGFPILNVELSTVARILFLTDEFVYEVALDQPLEIRIRGAGGTLQANLNCLDFRQRVTGIML